MSNFYRDNDDFQFYIDRGIDWEPLVRLTENEYRYDEGFDGPGEAVEFYREVFDLVGDFVANEIDPDVRAIDDAGLEFEDGEVKFPEELDEIFEKVKPMELHGVSVPRELGGMNCPVLVYMLNTELFARADVSISAHHGFHGGIAMALVAYSMSEGSAEFDEAGRIVETRFDDEIEEILSGEAWGSMDITEPDAGSDMAALRTSAEQDDEGNWYVTGKKIFITSGHGKYHVVIAKTEEDETGDDHGLDKLSTFLVKAYEENEEGERERFATVDRLEEKLGHHASATCQITFDETPARLIGERGEGFKQMLLLMNNARVGVSFEALGLCEKAYRLAKNYADERSSMGKPLSRHEMIYDYLEEMRTDIQGMRALAVEAGYCEEMARKSDMMLDRRSNLSSGERERYEAIRDDHRWRARKLTPLLKYITAERCVEMARMSLQIHGGVGYTTDYEPEKLLRDAMVMPIYEGTSQIQALMATKDILQHVMENPGDFVSAIAQVHWRMWSADDPRDKKMAKMRLASLTAQQHLIRKTAVDKVRSVTDRPISEWSEAFLQEWDPKEDFSYALLHAERLTKLRADVAITSILYEQAQDHPDRVDVFDRYVERALPRVRFLKEKITETGERLVDDLSDEVAPRAAE
jgi:alkylation response protein AidB-like acyl-CoA dehydrogenase